MLSLNSLAVKKRVLIVLACQLLLTFIAALFFYDLQAWAAVLVSLVVATGSVIAMNSEKVHIRNIILGFFLAAFWTFSTYKENFEPKIIYVISLTCALLCWTVFFCLIIEKLSNIKVQSENSQKSIRVFTIISMLLLFTIWFAYWLSFFPGILNSDSMSEWAQANGYQVLSEWHPLINTYLIKAFSFGGESPAPFLLMQIIFGVVSVVYVMRRLLRRGMAIWIGYTVVALYALYPMNGFYMTTMVKDIPYTILLLVLFSVMFELVETNGESLKNPRELLVFTLSMIFAALFRKNGLYVVYMIMIYTLTVVRKKRAIISTLIVVVAVTGFNKFNTGVLNATKSPISEALAIPIQQVASVYATNGVMPEKQREYFDSITTEHVWRDGYHKESVDSVKLNPNFNKNVIQNNPKLFIINWYRVFEKNKLLFVKAFLNQTATIWRMYTPTEGYMFGRYRVTLISAALPLTQRGGLPDYYHINLNNPKRANSLIKQSYINYKGSMTNNNQKPILSYSDFKSRMLRGYRNVRFAPKWKYGYSKLQLLFNSINYKYQKYIARGAIFVLILLVSICVGMSKMSFIKLMGVMLVPVINLATLVVSIPATDFRYVYSLVFSAIPIILYIVTNESDKKKPRHLKS